MMNEEEIRQSISSTIDEILRRDALGQDLQQKIKARAQGLPERVHRFSSAKRLMPLARNEINKASRSGRSFHSCVCWWAETLKQARGRFKRKWWAPTGGLYMCISLYPQLLPQNRQLYSLASGLAACQTLRDYGIAAEIRWINDVLVSGKKICGILSESITTQELGETYLLFGIGLNVNTTSFPKEIKDTSTSMLIETGKHWPIIQIGVSFLARLITCFCLLHQWEASCLEDDIPFSKAENPVITRYECFSNLKGRKVIYGKDLESEPGSIFVSHGITNDGSLILEEKGDLFTVNTGEIRFI